MESLDREILIPIEPRSTSKKAPQLANPLLNYIFNHQDIETSGPLKELVHQLCSNPNDYSILVPSTMFLASHVDRKSRRSYTEVCKDLEFVLSHIVRINVLKEPRIRTHKEFSLLSSKKVIINLDTVTSAINFKYPVSVKIIGQEFIRGFADYIPLGTCFHVVYITECLFRDYDFIGTDSNLLIYENSINLIESIDKIAATPADVVPFDMILHENSTLSVLEDQFQTLFKEYSSKKITNQNEINESFSVLIKSGSAMLNTLEFKMFNKLLEKYTPEQLTESVYDYLEKNIYELLWESYVKLYPNDEDKHLEIAYKEMKWLSITQIGLPDEIILDRKAVNEYLKKATAAIRHLKKFQISYNSSSKCKIIVKTVEILSANSTIDADTLIILLIFVISFSRVSNLSNHINYVKNYSYSHNRIENGLLGYALSSFEVAIKYFQNQEQLDRLAKNSSENELLWTLIGAVADSNSSDANKKDDESIFREIEQLLEPLNRPFTCFMPYHYVRSISLTGESCLLFALKQQNGELMNVLLQFEHVFTLDDILEDRNTEGSNILALALDMEHPCAATVAGIILNANSEEIKQYVNQSNCDGRTVGHFLHRAYHLIPKIGPFVEWNKRDKFGNTPLMIYIRSYDHPDYVNMMDETFKIVKVWYESSNRKFSHRDHTDTKRNTPMHMIRNEKVLEMFMNTFEELEMNYLNDMNQSAVSLAVRYNRLENIKALIHDPRVCLSIVDPRMHLSSLDYVKLERWGECVNREIAKLLEVQFIVTEYGENLDIACVRARFEPEHGLCCYFRVVNQKRESDIVLVPFDAIVKIFKLLKKENPSIPFDFNKPDIWFPKHGYVGMRGNINSSNKMRINTLINNLNLLIQSLYKNGTLEYTDSLQNYLLKPQKVDVLEVQTLDERNILKNIYIKDFEYKKNIFTDPKKFQHLIITTDDIISYEGFLNYTMVELESYLKIYEPLYRKFALNDVEAKELDKLRTDIPLIVDDSLKFRECRVEDSSDIFLDKLRLLYGTVNDLIQNVQDMKTIKMKRWKKLVSDLKMIRSELDRIAGSGVEGSATPSPYSGPTDTRRIIETNRKELLSKVFEQIDVLTSDSENATNTELFRKDILKTIYKDKYATNNKVQDELKIKAVEDLIDFKDTGIGSWFTEKRRVTYIKKLLNGFLKHRIELIELCVDLRRCYERLAVFVSTFYEFRVDVFKDAFKYYSKGKIDELKREVMAWELSLHAYRNH